MSVPQQFGSRNISVNMQQVICFYLMITQNPDSQDNTGKSSNINKEQS